MDKIQLVDPMDALAPMRSIDEPKQKDSREKSVSEAVQEEVESRMNKAADQLKAKYFRGGPPANETQCPARRCRPLISLKSQLPGRILTPPHHHESP